MQANDADGLWCAACKELMRDDNGNVRTSCLHRCSACRAPLHSTMMCSEVWEPIEHGDQTFCGQVCVEAYNAIMRVLRRLSTRRPLAGEDWASYDTCDVMRL